MSARSRVLWLLAPLTLVIASASGKPLSDEDSFIQWARASLAPLSTLGPESDWKDLAPLGKMIGDASVVTLGEGVHVGAEPLEFRNRLLQYLVEQKGFTAIAIESGIVEGRAVHDYVRGGSGELSPVMAKGITWTFDRVPQYHAMVRWLRDYNANARHARKVNFYGFDTSGSPGNPQANRHEDTALTEALNYLSSVDSAPAAAFYARLHPLMKNIRFLIRRPADASGYDRLSQNERDTLTAAIADLIALLERNEARYTAASTPGDYEWGYRAAIGARQVDDMLRLMPVGWRPPSDSGGTPSDPPGFLNSSADIRDRAQADNIDWIVKREGPRGKVLVFAHRIHLSTSPVKGSIPPKDSQRAVAGTYLRQRYDDRMVTIGNVIGQGKFGCGDYMSELKPGPANSIDGIAAQVGSPRFVLDLRTAPTQVTRWLNQEQLLAHSDPMPRVVVGKAFDILFYIDTVTPACVDGK